MSFKDSDLHSQSKKIVYNVYLFFKKLSEKVNSTQIFSKKPKTLLLRLVEYLNAPFSVFAQK